MKENKLVDLSKDFCKGEHKMTHSMHLHSRPFELIASGIKTIELRLCDEKRKLIKIGDQIIFTNSENQNQQIYAIVRNIYCFSSFEELYQKLPLDKCGYLPDELSTASPRDMEMYYSTEEQKKHGVLGIELELTVK